MGLNPDSWSLENDPWGTLCVFEKTENPVGRRLVARLGHTLTLDEQNEAGKLFLAAPVLATKCKSTFDILRRQLQTLVPPNLATVTQIATDLANTLEQATGFTLEPITPAQLQALVEESRHPTTAARLIPKPLRVSYVAPTKSDVPVPSSDGSPHSIDHNLPKDCLCPVPEGKIKGSSDGTPTE